MPRLPTILATQGVDTPPGARIARAPVSPYADLAVDLSNQVSGLADNYAKMQQKAAHQEAGLIQADFEQRLGVADVQLRASQTDPDGYVSDYQKLAAQTLEDVTKDSKNAQAAALARQHLAPVLARNRVAAEQHAQTLRKDQSIATMDAVLSARLNQAGLATSDEEFRRHYYEGLNAITLATPDIGASKAGDAKRKFTQDILGTRALQEVNADPEGFLKDADSRFGRAGLDPKHLEQLKEKAQSEVDKNRKERNRIAEGAQKDLEETYQRDVRSLVTDFDARTAKATTDEERAGIGRDLELRRELRQIEGEDYRRIRQALDAPKDTPSDPDILTEISIRANRAKPLVSEEELDRLRRTHQQGGKGLSPKDYMTLKSMVIGRVDKFQSEGDSEKTRRHNQAEQILQRGLGISSLYDKIDDQDKQLLDVGLRELTARSNAFDGKEDPLVVTSEYLLRVQPMRQERLKLKVPEIGRTLRFRANDSQTADSLLKDAVSRGLIKPGSAEERIEQRKILDMLRAEQAMELSQAKAGGGKSGSGGKELRKPGQKPQTGTTE